MSDRVFLDTNLWVYFFAKDPLDKAERITDIVNAQLLPPFRVQALVRTSSF
jgi:predicted nucleic acid-binding protein